MSDIVPPPRRFLGWDTVVGGAWLQLLHVSLFFYSFGIYVLAWDEELGWSRTATSGGYAIVTLMTGMLGIILGRLLERVGVRRVVVFGLAVLAAGFVALSFAASLAHFYAAMVVIGLGLAASGFLSITTAIVPWFTTRRSTALALMSLGLSLGGLVVPLLASGVVDLFASIMGASMAVFMLGQLIGPVFAGSMADTFGDYRAAFMVLAVVAAASSAAFWFATPPVTSSDPAAGTATARTAPRPARSPRA